MAFFGDEIFKLIHTVEQNKETNNPEHIRAAQVP